MLRSRLDAALSVVLRLGRGGFLLASLAIHLALFGVIALAPGRGPSETPVLIVPVELVEAMPEPAPEPLPDPEPLPTPAPEPVETSAGPSTSSAPTAPPPSIRSPITALAGEVADAAQAESQSNALPEMANPVPGPQMEQAVDALRAVRCNQFGKARPADCDDVPEILNIRDDLVDAPDITPKEWEAFEIYRPDPEIQRIQAEGCPPGGGVIKDVFTHDTTYYRQGAHAAAGSLSANSVNKNCP